MNEPASLQNNLDICAEPERQIPSENHASK